MHHANDFVSPINTVWVLVTAFLVFFMQAGFMGLEVGFARSRETVNILMECVFDTCLCGLLYWAIGFAFQFGAGNGFIGHQFFFLHGMTAGYGTTGVAFLAFWLFQFAFADTASTITSGAMVGRTELQGRHPLQRVRVGLHLPDLRPLGLGSRRLVAERQRHALQALRRRRVLP